MITFEDKKAKAARLFDLSIESMDILKDLTLDAQQEDKDELDFQRAQFQALRDRIPEAQDEEELYNILAGL